MAIATHVCVVLRSVSALFIVPLRHKSYAILLSAFIRLRLFSLSSGTALICSLWPVGPWSQPFLMVDAQILLWVLEMVVISDFYLFSEGKMEVAMASRGCAQLTNKESDV